MPDDTSSAPAAKTTVVQGAAAAWAALIVDLMPARSVAAVATISGIAITNDIPHLPTVRLSPVWSPRKIRNDTQRIAVLAANSILQEKILVRRSLAQVAAPWDYVENAQDSAV